MSFVQKCELVLKATAAMDSSKMACLDDATYFFQTGREDEAKRRLEKAAQYAWGFWRPTGWAV